MGGDVFLSSVRRGDRFFSGSLFQDRAGRRSRSSNRVPGKNLSPRRTTYDGQKHTPLIMGAQFSFWSFFIDFELMSDFFVSQKNFSTNILLFKMVSIDFQISSFESHTLVERFQNENQT